MQVLEAYMADLMEKQESVMKLLHEASAAIQSVRMGGNIPFEIGVPVSMDAYKATMPPTERTILRDRKTEELERAKQELEKKLLEKSHTSAELEQEKMVLSEMLDSETVEKHALQKKHYISIGIAAIVLAAAFGGFLYYESVKNAETQRILLNAVKSKYLVQNLKGDTVDTWVSWVLIGNTPMFINIINSDAAPQEKVDAVKDVILSKETIAVDDTMLNPDAPGGTKITLYKGWVGALEKAAERPTKFTIPKNIEIIESDAGGGAITIELTNLKDPDGFAGYTNSVVDGNQILKSRIIIYEVDKLTDEKLTTVVRHELGHAFGLGHSTATEDLMNPVVKTKYPFISECDINAFVSLYDDKKSSEVVCEK